MELAEKYKLNPNVTENLLRVEGFRRGIFKCDIYKNIVQLIVHIDIEEQWWSYQVCNMDSDSLYVPYYDRRYGGRNLIIEEIDEKMRVIFEEMKDKGIFKLDNK